MPPLLPVPLLLPRCCCRQARGFLIITSLDGYTERLQRRDTSGAPEMARYRISRSRCVHSPVTQ